jgi:short-subunit dehydrogenase
VERPVILITGASAGIGAAFARLCAKRGDEVLLVARRQDRLDVLAAELGGKAHVVAMDLTRPGAAVKLVQEVEARGLTVSTLINNAGFGVTGRFADLPLDRQLKMIDLNVRLLTELTGCFLPAMRARRAGAVLNVASTAAFQAGPGMAVYFATKAFVLSFTEALHAELKGTGVKVSALCPGPVATEFAGVAGLNSKAFDRLAGNADAVAKAGLAGLARNRTIIVPGFQNKVGAQAYRLLPRAALRRIIAAVKF